MASAATAAARPDDRPHVPRRAARSGGPWRAAPRRAGARRQRPQPRHRVVRDDRHGVAGARSRVPAVAPSVELRQTGTAADLSHGADSTGSRCAGVNAMRFAFAALLVASTVTLVGRG